MKMPLALFFLLCFFVSISYASLNIVPQRIESTVKPNVPIKGSYSVTNNYDGDVNLEVFVELQNEWSYKGNLDIPVDSWLKIVPSKLTMKKGETRLILYTIFPNESMQGSIAGQVRFKVNPPKSSINVIMSLPIHIIMQGTEKIEYSVDSLSINENVKKLDIGIRNDGNIIIHPVGMVDIYKGKKKVKSVQLFEGFSVFPNSIRKEFSVDLPSDLAPGKYKAEVSIKLIGYSHFVAPAVKSMEFRVLKDGRII
jgi:hypothetical protein